MIFLAQKDLRRTLCSTNFNPKAALTVRLENVVPTRAMDRMNTALCKKQRPDGTWERPVLIELPKEPAVATDFLVSAGR
eukprot:2831829-Pleurochrysis_carterae.AAC.1